MGEEGLFNGELIMLTTEAALDDDVADGGDLSLYIILRT